MEADRSLILIDLSSSDRCALTRTIREGSTQHEHATVSLDVVATSAVLVALDRLPRGIILMSVKPDWADRIASSTTHLRKDNSWEYSNPHLCLGADAVVRALAAYHYRGRWANRCRASFVYQGDLMSLKKVSLIEMRTRNGWPHGLLFEFDNLPSTTLELHMHDVETARKLAKVLNDSLQPYQCGVCGSSDKTRWMRCEHPACPDGRDH